MTGRLAILTLACAAAFYLILAYGSRALMQVLSPSMDRPSSVALYQGAVWVLVAAIILMTCAIVTWWSGLRGARFLLCSLVAAVLSTCVVIALGVLFTVVVVRIGLVSVWHSPMSSPIGAFVMFLVWSAATVAVAWTAAALTMRVGRSRAARSEAL